MNKYDFIMVLHPVDQFYLHTKNKIKNLTKSKTLRKKVYRSDKKGHGIQDGEFNMINKREKC